MNKSTYAVEAEVEANHWWFVGRRRLFRELINGLQLQPDAKVLDIGTSTGSNLRLLKELGFTCRRGLDLNDEAIRWCHEKGLGVVEKGDICALPFEDGVFELVLATDIIEHVDDDSRAIEEIGRVLTPGGVAIISVPAFEFLWGLQDDVSHHRRRYRKSSLINVIRRGGLECSESFYFNYLLFGPICAARQLMKLLRIRVASEGQINTPLLNRILTYVFALDVLAARRVHSPIGVSIVALARRAG